MKYFFAFVAFFSVICSFAQFEEDFVPTPIEDTIPASILSVLKSRLESDKTAVAAVTKDQNAYMKSLYDERFKYVIENFNKDYFITQGETVAYLQQILNSLYQANPELKKETSAFLFRSEIPNAFSFGDGTIGFTLGLMTKMESESQIAFVLAHELAHHHARHSDLKIKELTRLNFDKEVKKKVKEIKSSHYGRYTKLKQLYQDLGLSITSHGRDHEFEADSVALIYYLRAGYDGKEALRTMEILDSADHSNFTRLLDLKRSFHHKEYPFKDQWIEYTASTTWHRVPAAMENDSLQTHPSCKRRIAALERQLATSNQASGTKKQFNSINQFAAQSEFDLVETNYHFKRYGRALFLALALQSTYPDNIYLHAVTAKCMYQLYQYQKNHELGKVLELPDPRFEENYDRLLSFLHTLRLQEIASLAYYYSIARPEDFFSNEEFLYSFWLCSQLPASKIDPEKVKSDYKSKFPSGKYTSSIK